MRIKQEWLNDKTAYKPTDIDDIINKIWSNCSYTYEGKTKYLNIPASFDIETTSFYDVNGDKTSIMYVWMLGLCGLVIMGRTWEEWIYTYNRLVEGFRTCGKKVLIIYIHNASFDFQFIRKHHKYNKIFATDKYQPLYAQTEEGIEFRCSYRLSGYSLDTLGKNLMYHKIRKLKGDMDYREKRHSETPLSDKEIQYCINDAKVVCAYIDELIERENGINNIPLTKTGFVRRYSREECFKDKDYHFYMKNLVLTLDEYKLAREGFQGGYTHSNPELTNTLLHDVTSLDIISSYPSVMVDELFPMSSPKHISIKNYSELKYYCSHYCCIFQIQFNNIKPRYWFDFYISASKCKIYGKRILSNGRLVSADSIITTITNVDFDIIEYMYKFDKENISIGDFMICDRGYLPTNFVRALLNTYQKKTELKGVEGKEIEYAVFKENQNSYYGMTVTSVLKDEYKYINDTWVNMNDLLDEIQIQEQQENDITRYNKSYNRHLYYLWGVFVTAYARHNIWESIIECGYDHIYADTDSEKCLNFSVHAEFFKQYNNRVIEKHKRACKVHGLSVDLCMPKNKKGDVKILGAFDYEGTYDKFKTLGAKRYLTQTGNDFSLTVAGLNKKTGLEYMLKKFGKNKIFDAFADGLQIPSEYSGRLIHTYIDETRTGILIDKYGKPCEYKELSAIHLEPAAYTIGDISAFVRFINQIKEGDLPWEL